MYAREQRYLDEKGSLGEAATEPEKAADAERKRWGFLSGFCGADSVSFSSAPLGGTPIAGFGVVKLVQRLWQERTGIACWGGFGSVLEARSSPRRPSRLAQEGRSDLHQRQSVPGLQQGRFGPRSRQLDRQPTARRL